MLLHWQQPPENQLLGQGVHPCLRLLETIAPLLPYDPRPQSRPPRASLAAVPLQQQQQQERPREATTTESQKRQNGHALQSVNTDDDPSCAY
ncbi:unnamed protein product [Sphagnum troendelagicum]